MSIDNQYVRRYRQHIPFYKSEFPFEDRRVYWHHNRCLCENDCIFGIPIVHNQYLMFAIEDDSPTGEEIQIFGASANSRFELCCINEGDAADCENLEIVSNSGQDAIETKICVENGQPIQFNYFRFQLQDTASCGLHYLKLIAYEGTSNERVFYSQPVYVYRALDVGRLKLLKLNINDSCQVGGIKWSQIWQGWPFIDGYEVYLPENSATAFVDEVTDGETEEDGVGNEIQVFKSVSWRYQFDTGYVPEFYAEMIAEITQTDNNAISIPDRNAIHYVEFSNAESSIQSDNDGCLVNVNINYLINKYNTDACCDVDECECPQDDAQQVISYVVDQNDAEIDVEIGDTYIVPNNGSAITNPDWSTHDNEIAVWNGSGWNYSVPNAGDIVYNQALGQYMMSKGVGDIWILDLLFITSAVSNGPGTCTWNVEALIPNGVWAKLQWMQSGSGIWNDSTGNFLNQSEWLSGQTHSSPFANTYELRLVALDTGCDIPNGNIVQIVQVGSCV